MPAGLKHDSHRVRDAIAVVGAWLLSGGFFFSSQWTSGFDRVMGNAGDSRLMVYLNQQWFLVLRGSQPWRNPPFFYPVKGLLGYTDTFFLWQLFFAPMRMMGAEAISCVSADHRYHELSRLRQFRRPGSMGSPRLPLRRHHWCDRRLFAFANNLAEHVGSAQVFGMYLVPPIALVGLLPWRESERPFPEASVLLSIVFGALWGLLLFSTYYVAWLSLFAACLIVLLMFLFSPRAIVAAATDLLGDRLAL